MKYQFTWDKIYCCADCPFANDYKRDDVNLDWYCSIGNLQTIDLYKKPDWCPLILIHEKCFICAMPADNEIEGRFYCNECKEGMK